MSSVPQSRLGHRPALDGLRGIAILLVLVGHASPVRFEAAGSVGVSVFFALSGFLITALLLEEWQRTDAVSLRAFYARRARRLLPALGVFLTGVAILQLAGVHLVAQPVREFTAALLYCSNFFTWHHWTGLGHLWSLSVEEQFYIVFPLCLVWALRRGVSRRTLLIALGLAAGASAVLRIVMWSNVDLAYHATETNAVALLLGCALAVAITGSRERPVLGAWATISIGGVILAASLGERALLWSLLEPVVAILTVVAIFASVKGPGPSWLRVPVLTYVGRRSYALYLWHFPFATLSWKREMPMWSVIVIAFVAAELSWRLVEMPVLGRRHRATGLPTIGPGPEPTALTT